MKKREPARLYPKYESITLKNFLLHEKQLIVLIILLIITACFVISCILAADFFRAEHTYNFIGGV